MAAAIGSPNRGPPSAEKRDGTYQTKPFRPHLKNAEMKARFFKTVTICSFWVFALLLVAILFGVPFWTDAARAQGLPHNFSGTVYEIDGTTPAEGVQVSAWINGEQATTTPVSTNSSGGFTSMLVVSNYRNGDRIVFKLESGYIPAVVTEREGVPQIPQLQAIPFQEGTTENIKLKYGPEDTTSPDAISDLFVEEAKNDEVRLSWTAPGDDDSSGTAIYYDVRYSAAEITNANWELAISVNRTAVGQDYPIPKAAGGAETITIINLTPSTTYHFAVKAFDEDYNDPGVSNCVSVRTADVVGGLPSTYGVYGTVNTTGGQPAADVRVQAWVNGLLTHTLATDSQGKLGGVSGPYLTAYGPSNSPVFFVVDGEATQVRIKGQETWLPSLPLKNFQIHEVEIRYEVPDIDPPTVMVNTPDGGERLRAGTPYDITWTATDDTGVTSVNISYSTNNGGSYLPIADDEDNDGTYTWTVPEVASTTCLVKVKAGDKTGKTGEDESDAVFRIFLSGDADDDGDVSSADIYFTEQIITEVETEPELPHGADANDDDSINILDITEIEHLIP